MDARKLAAVLDCVFDCVLTLDPVGNIVTANRATEETFGYTREELTHKTLSDLVPGGANAPITNAPRLAPRRPGYVGRRYDGSEFPLELSLTRIDGSGAPTTVATLRDASRYARSADEDEGFAEELLGDLEVLHDTDQKARDVEGDHATIELLLSVANCANYSMSLREALASTLELLCNHLGWELGHAASLDAGAGALGAIDLWFGAWPAALLGARASDVTRGLSGAAIERRLPVVFDVETRRPGDPVDGLAEVRNGLAFPILIEGQAVAVIEAYSLQRRPLEPALLGISTLIGGQLGLVAQRQQREGKLREAVAAAETAVSQRSEFLSNMSHEFRTPMHAIINYTNLALRGVERADLAKSKQYLSNVQISAKRLLRLLNDVLDLAKMESGRFHCELVTASFESVLDKTAVEVEALLNAKGMRLERAPATCGSSACFDETRMVQVLVNLLSNSIKFSPDGSVVTISLQDVVLHGEPALECRVRDRGVGIPLDELDAIFDKFQQSGRTKNGSGGTGLGLAISRQIVGAHHGRIWAENNVEGGADMIIWIPRANTRCLESARRGLN